MSGASGVSGRLWLPVAVCVALTGVVISSALFTPPDILRAALQEWEFWWLEALFAALVASTTAAVRRLQVPRAVVALSVGMGLLAAGLSAIVAPRTNRIYYDEHIYQGVAQNLSDQHRAQMCNDGTLEYGRLQCWRAEFNKEPIGYPHLLSIVYRLGGANERAAFHVNNVVGGLTAAVVVLLAWLLFADRLVSGFAGAAFVMLPMQLWWSNTAAAEPFATLATSVACLAVVNYAKVQSTQSLAWSVVATAYATTVRPESMLAVPLAGLALLLLAPSMLRRAAPWWGAAGGLGLISVSVLHLAAVRHDGWGTAGPRFSWDHVWANLPSNSWFYLGVDERFPPLIAVAALLALAVGAGWRAKGLLVAYFVAFWGVFVAFYAGSYYYGADVRYALLSHVPLVVLAGLGLARVVEALRLRLGSRAAVAAVAGVMIAQFSWSLPAARSTGEEAWAARADIAVASTFLQRIPPNSIILTHNPSVFHLMGQNAAQLSLAVTDPSYVRDHLLRRYAGGVYLHWNFWCNVSDPVQTQFCRTAVAAFPSDEIASARERDYVYRLFRLRAPDAPGP